MKAITLKKYIILFHKKEISKQAKRNGIHKKLKTPLQVVECLMRNNAHNLSNLLVAQGFNHKVAMSKINKRKSLLNIKRP